MKDLNQHINWFLDDTFSKKLNNVSLLVDDGIVPFFSQPNKVSISLIGNNICFVTKVTPFFKTRYLTPVEVEEVVNLLLDSDNKGDEEFYELWDYLKTLTID